MNVTEWADRVIRVGFYLLFGLVPLLLTPWNYELFEYNKMMAVYAITVVIAAAWLTKSIAEKKFTISRTPLDIPILLFLASQFLSSLFSIDPHVSWFGYYSRFNGGMWSVVSYIVLFYAFVTHVKQAVPFFVAGLSTAVVVALYGVAERLGIDKHLWVQDVQNRVFSTLGQPNWLAAYLVALAPLSMAFATKARTPKPEARNVVWMGVSVLFFAVLLFTKSRSGLLAFAVADILFWLLQGPKQIQRATLKLGGALHLVFALIVFFNGTGVESVDRFVTLRGVRTQLVHTNAPAPAVETVTGPVLETGGTESGVIRKYVWEGAITAWRATTKTMLVGTGTETFAFAFFKSRPVAHNLTSEWDFLYNKAHNEYLNYLATTGVFGLGSYLLFIGAVLLLFFRSKKDSIAHAVFAGWASILVTNFFGFSVVVTQVLLFLFPAFLFEGKPKHIAVRLPHWGIWIAPVIGAVTLVCLSRMWYADSQFAAGYRQVRAGNAAEAATLLQHASRIQPGEPLYHDELGSLYSSIAAAAHAAGDATTTAVLTQQSIAESDRAIATSPQNVNFWKTRTRIYVSLSDIDPQYTADAIDALTRAQELSPNDPKILYNLAILHGRLGDGDASIQLLTKAIAIKPNYRDAYFALSLFYADLGRMQESQDILHIYLETVDPNDADFKERVAP